MKNEIKRKGTIIFGTEIYFPTQGLGPQGYPVYQEQAQNQKGINTPISGVTGFPGGCETSEAGSICRQVWNGEPNRELQDYAKEKHRKILEDMKAFPKPNLKGI